MIARTTRPCGFIRTARTPATAAGSLQPSISRISAASMNRAATASTWPHSDESYQVTGMNRKSAAARTPRRSPNQRLPARYSRAAIAMSATTAGTFRRTTRTEPCRRPDGAGDDVGNDADKPEDVDVAGRVVRAPSGLVEPARPHVDGRLGPARELAEVSGEALAGCQDESENDAQKDSGDEDDRDGRHSPDGYRCRRPDPIRVEHSLRRHRVGPPSVHAGRRGASVSPS